ncbi:MAG: hypothetical protein JWM80_4445, partial [Cyanobacteria bacterium RYN_339]|nr:hypothetical protein [Cyanobacteria bacterium RYN_339]
EGDMSMNRPVSDPQAWCRHGGTLGALLERQATHCADLTYVQLLADDGTERRITYGDLAVGARRVAAAFQGMGLAPGFRVLIVLPTGVEFIDTFYGTVLAGGVAIPAYPPLRSKGLTDYQERLARLIKVAKPDVVVTFSKVRLVVEAATFAARVPARVVEPSALTSREAFRPVEVDPEAVAMVQFSSGSTGDPRGVMLSHRNLLANVAAVLDVLQPDETDVNCSWLPLYHDMGLIGGLFMPLFCGRPVVLLSPQGFLLDPKRWLWAIHKHRATISTAPNFAYQLIAGRVDERELVGLDLSCWRLALCGAEPVMPETLAAFAQKLAPHGFKEAGLLPVYGLAEVALGALFPVPGVTFRRDQVDPAALEREGQAVPGDRVLSSVGKPLPGFDVRIAGADGAALAERRVGEIQLRGPSVMVGYLDDPAATARAMVDGWLRTGDLGYLADGELYVVGRSKDLILKGGRNYAPQDLENAAERVPGVRRGCVAAFGVPDPVTGTEAVVVAAETREPAAGHAALRGAIAEQVLAAVGLRPDHITLLPPGAVPKTSSGKLQRSRARERWLAGSLVAPQEPGMGDMVRVVGRALAQRMVGTRRQAP